MNTVTNNTLSSHIISHYFGSLSPKVIFYLPTPPVIPPDWRESETDAVKQLIDANGNHWRKITVIISKLVCKKLSCWRETQTRLLQQNSDEHLPVAIAIVSEPIERDNDILLDPAILHIICGKNTFSRFTIKSELLNKSLSLNKNQTILYHQQVFLSPYLDYRQFPNALIELLRPMLHQSS
ncbi:DUF6942 family protein [Shewanella sp. OMA3-2]|uniref:DUF6942 family protein n=1 Tax=Shewanella sp. OMA3-2 TaxID=2908650 RepID=UPI001F42F6E5|nr:hypothetical protein [Shewanella sp. OMA3-2]UJF23312.1 hypothetical protein L0B17_08370 [Shewanella sp. OMA3-2]